MLLHVPDGRDMVQDTGERDVVDRGERNALLPDLDFQHHTDTIHVLYTYDNSSNDLAISTKYYCIHLQHDGTRQPNNIKLF